MLKKLQQAALIFCCAILFTPSLFAQETESVSLITYWEKGEVFKYEKIKGKKKYDAGVLQDSTAEKSIFKLTVIDSTANDYVMEVNYESEDLGKLESLDQLGVDGSELLMLLVKYRELKINYRIDSLGKFLAIEEPEMFIDFSKEFSRILTDAVKKKGELPPEHIAIMEKLASPKIFINNIFQEIQMMHSLFGKEWPLDTLFSYADELPNLGGGDSIPVDADFTISWYDEDIVQAIQNHYIKEDNFGTFIHAFMGDVIGKEEINGSMNDSFQLFIEPNRGIVYAYFHDRTIDQPGSSTVTFTEIRLIE